MKRILLTAAALACSGGVWAADNAQPSARFLLGGGLTFGGAKLQSVPFIDTRTKEVTVNSVRAGELVQLYAGGEFVLGGPVALQATLGVHLGGSGGENGSVNFIRMPVDLLALYTIDDKYRVGAGAQLVSGAELKGSGAGASIVGAKREYKANTGLIVEGEYKPSTNIGLKVRYVAEKYKQVGTNKSFDGSHLGLMMNYYFGK